jgi:uroporphyrinogen decarboxylase
MHSRERFLAALRGDALDRPPTWLMRQAGRYLPGYRALRAEHSFWDVCQNPELSTRAALEPLDKFKLDAAIVFSDILVVPLAMGLGVTFGPGEGPRIAKPLRTAADWPHEVACLIWRRYGRSDLSAVSTWSVASADPSLT